MASPRGTQQHYSGLLRIPVIHKTRFAAERMCRGKRGGSRSGPSTFAAMLGIPVKHGFPHLPSEYLGERLVCLSASDCPTPSGWCPPLGSGSQPAPVVERFRGKAGNWLWDRFRVHYTPKHGSRLNQAEIAISLFSRQCLGQRRIGDRASLRRQTLAWSRRMNRHHLLIQWKFTRKKARATFAYTITRTRC